MAAINYSSPENREAFFMRLYKNAFPQVAGYISRRGGSFDEAKDVFQDALVIYYEKAIASTLKIKSDEKSYIIGIAKHLWLKRYRANDKSVPLDDLDINEYENENLSSGRLMYFLEKAGHKCMELLRSFYYDQQPLTEIAEQYGFSGVRSATVQKYKCLEKVRETIKQKALVYEDFME